MVISCNQESTSQRIWRNGKRTHCSVPTYGNALNTSKAMVRMRCYWPCLPIMWAWGDCSDMASIPRADCCEKLRLETGTFIKSMFHSADTREKFWKDWWNGGKWSLPCFIYLDTSIHPRNRLGKSLALIWRLFCRIQLYFQREIPYQELMDRLSSCLAFSVILFFHPPFLM